MIGLLRTSLRTQVRASQRRLLSTAAATYDQSLDTFPSIVIGPNKSIVPQGSFAEAQAQYLDPDPEAVETLAKSLKAANMGVVAHYYMDVELQGVLTAVSRTYPELKNRVGIADSLKMGDFAVDMCNAHKEVDAVACLGVDFMSESVAAILERNELGHIPVYRATAQSIGCSLAESAERDSYRAWLTHNSKDAEQALHVVYINTSLETKAVSSSVVPTITCTSSNVLQTLLQASAQVGPNLQILYGPDTYMGHNLQTLLDVVGDSWNDEKIRTLLHPAHSKQSIKQLRDALHVFPNGNCIVHHMFGQQVVDTVKKSYDDCYVTAHLEVPGEMFEIAMHKSLTDQGVVGSTSDILNFISRKVTDASAETQRLRFILGTEAGMVTAIVKSVQDILEKKGSQIEAEIIFPVASEAVMGVDDGGLGVVPGVGGGEGCSTAGGCATCPFMKMNDLDALQHVLEMKQSGSVKLTAHLPPNRLQGKSLNGVPASDMGAEPILYMREFNKTKALPESLVTKIGGKS